MVKRFLAVIVLLVAGLVWLGVHARRPDLGGTAAVLLVLALPIAGVLHLIFNVWLTPWRVEHTGNTVVRVHRRSGHADVLTEQGWRPLTAAPVPSAPSGAPTSAQ